MYADYGEIRGTKGLDGDPVDVYVGPDEGSDKVFIVTQMKKGDWEKVDEEKCILGVHTKREARALYLKHYDDPRFCGAIREMSMPSFIERLQTKARVGKKIASATARIAEINYLRMQQGIPVLIGGRHGVKVGADETLDPQWDNDIPDDVKRKMRRDAPLELENRRISAIGESEVTKDEQRGIGIPESRVADNPTDSKMRKAAALARIEAFLKHAAREKERPLPDRSHLPSTGVTLGALGGTLAALGLAGPVGRAIARREFAGKPTVSPNVAGTLLALGGGGGGGYLGYRLGRHMQDQAEARDRMLRGKHAADSDRVSRISNRVDDVGIGVLAAPYAARSLAGALEHRPGMMGAVGRGARAAANAMHHHENKMELTGLALVAPGVGHRVARGIDRAVPARTRAVPVPPRPAPKRSTDAKLASAAESAKNLLRGGARLGAGTVLAAGAGVGAGLYGAKRMTEHHLHEGISTPTYTPPRLF